MQSQQRAYAYALSAVLLWSTVASAFKLSLRYLDPYQLLAGSSCVSMALLAVIATVRERSVRRALVPVSLHEWGRSLLLGSLNPCLYYVVLFQAYALLPAQEAQLLNYTWAVTLTLLSVPLLGHKVTGRDLLAILVSYGGVAVIATRGALLRFELREPLGVALALGSTVIWALYWLLNARDTRDPVIALARNFLCGTPLTVLAAALFSSLRVSDPRGLLGAAYVGVFEMGLTFVLWLNALKATRSAAKVSNLIFLSPCISLLLIRLLVGEPIHRSTVVGLGLIVGGNLLQHAGRWRTADG